MENVESETLQLGLVYLRKYLALKRRCEDVQLANEKLVNRIYNVKKILKRYKKERSFLMAKLDDLGDDYQDEMVPAMWEEGAGEEEGQAELDAETDMAVASITGLTEEKTSLSGVGNAQNLTGDVPGAQGGEPKKPKKTKTISPYMVFCSHRRSAIQQQYLEKTGEEASRAELTKLFTQEWSKLSLEEKQVYQLLAQKKKQESEAKLMSVKQEMPDTMETMETNPVDSHSLSSTAANFIKQE